MQLVTPQPPQTVIGELDPAIHVSDCKRQMNRRVKLGDSAAPRSAVVIADRAIGTDQSKRFVLVVGADNKAQYREVRIGRLVDGLRVIESGLKPGEIIVVNGLQRVRPGAPVTPQTVPMEAKASPATPEKVASKE